MKIAVCVPHYGPLRPDFVDSLTELIALTAGAEINYNGVRLRPQIKFFREESGPVDYKRNRLVKRALAWQADYIQWIDNDQTFPPNATFRLAAHDLPIVGCNYVQRVGPPVPTVYKGANHRILSTPEHKGAVEEVASVGFGFCLMKSEIFRVVPKPWFSTNLTDDGEVLQSDDVHFNNQARSAGIPVHVDHGLSLEIGHISEVILTMREGVDVDTVLPAGAQ